MQARRRAQPSGTNSPSSSHPRWKAPSAMRDLRSVPAMRPPGSPRCGDLAGSNTSEPRGSAPRERDHRGGDHPVPSRTRQLSPPSPRVLQRQAAGGQGVALAEGAFLMRAARGPRGRFPLRASLCLAGVAASLAALRATAARFRAAGPGRGSRAGPEGALRAVPLAGPIGVLGR